MDGGAGMPCSSCGKEVSENEVYIYEGKRMCEDCAIKTGLYPLGHIGARKDKISEKGRCLTVPKPDER
jgi:recombinational DNA repair protein (RecF pathway)